MGIKKLAKNADLCPTCMDSRLVTRITAGVRDKKVREELLAIQGIPTLNSIVDLCRAKEHAVANNIALSKGANCNKLSRYRGRIKSRTRESGDPCDNCGYFHGEFCPAAERTQLE